MISTGIKSFCGALLIALTVPAASAQAAGVPSHLDFITHNQVEIDAPPAAVWPHILKMEEWKKGNRLEPVEPGSNRLGSRFNSMMGETLAYTVENAEFVPERVRTLRLNELDGTLIGYATLRLTPRGQSTVVQYDVYCLMATPPEVKEAADWTKYLAENSKRFDEELLALKALSETGGGQR